MCGIYGIWQSPRLSRDELQGTLDRMGQRLLHRGPDDHGTAIIEPFGIGLGHRRLSIVDLSPAGRQPMTSDDGQMVVTFNGEIYNYQTLRSELQHLGHRFRTKTDTEVLLVGYQQWGADLFLKLAGMFAFAIWDQPKQQLILVRDPTGVKPLFYTHGSDYFGFASEVKGFLAWPRHQVRLSPHAMEVYLEFGYLYDGVTTMFEGVKKVPAGHVITVHFEKEGAIRVDAPKRWWHFPTVDQQSKPDEVDLDQLTDELHGCLQEVVASQLQADVPVGLLLSGGLDSSLLAAYASREVKQPLRTVCMGFDPTPFDERPYARQVADFLKTDHREMICRPDDLLEDISRSMLLYDDLFVDTGFLSSLAIYRSCKEQGLTVMLVGEGSDELFGGYGNFAASQRSWQPSSLFRYQQYRYRSSQQWGASLGKMVHLQDELLQEATGDRFQALRLFELQHQIPNNLNMKVDRSSMASSIEARVPFQDPRLLQLAMRWPAAAFLHQGSNKRVLRRVAEKYQMLPREIYERPKFGMMMPGQWMDQASRFRTLARESILRADGLADRFGLRQPMERFFADKNDSRWRYFRKHLAYNTVAWRLGILSLWCDAWRREGVEQGS